MKNKISDNLKHNLKAIIWDFDGTIADTEYKHAKTETAALKKYRINISNKTIVKRFAGVKLIDIFQTLFDENNVKEDCRQACTYKWKMMHEIINKKTPKFMPGVKKILKECERENIKMAIASSSIKSYLDLAIKKMKIKNFFEVIISGDDVKNGKPNPEIFLKTTKHLKVKPKQCLVIEDGTAGVIAAQSAKIKCIATGDHIDKSILKKTSIYIDTLKKVDLDFINNMF